MVNKIIRYTNEKIAESVKKGNYTAEDLKKHPHIRDIDQVIYFFFLPLEKCDR